ncbi:hypothetical protein N7447_003761 [Penicillium robsamsonii]|uniref:uncharacterized protein n=1 Tax=Penicillium robsamsonii TaxID=1792511 RepID=UPI002546F504|nr:uncharacterized protein N7447_003761 [Penicillium robsamsonii]KAJ5826998.1 hypothetical protein N7447_003761 [Penicillium robsamsonii]
MADGELGWAPVHAPRTVLDLGCGTAHKHPNARIIGLDLEPIDSSKLPQNCSTAIADLENEWPISHRFDYIHTRWLVGCLFDWPLFFKRCYASMEEGGWMEVLDIGFPCQSADGSLFPNSAIPEWNDLLVKAAKISGRELTVAAKFGEFMREAGFKNVTVIEKRLPQNPWPEDAKERALGEIALPIHQDGHERLGHDYLIPNLGMSIEEVDIKLEVVKKDMENPNIHAWWPM